MKIEIIRSAAITRILFLTFFFLAGCGGGGGGGNDDDGDPTLYSIGGSVSGLTGTGLVLQNNGGNNLTISSNGAFTFSTSLADGADYSVTVGTQPSGQTCSVSNGTGTVASANVTTITVNCAANSGTQSLTISKAGTGEGSVDSSPNGIDCGGDCNESYASGTEVTLTADADDDSTFEGWSGDCAGTTPTITTTLDADHTCIATFNSEDDSQNQTVSAGALHTCAVLTDGTVNCWGKNSTGRLGNSTITDSPSPVVVTGISTARAVAAGFSHSCAILTDSTVRCWGDNLGGQLGTGLISPPIITSTTPVTAIGVTDALNINAGFLYTCALISNGTIKCWGSNVNGMLGDGTTLVRNDPVEVSGITTAVDISTANFHACAVLSNGTIKCWGVNTSGQLGNGTLTDSHAPVTVSGISTARSVSAGLTHTCAALSDGTIKCWGVNLNGELGNGTNVNSSVPVTVSGITTARSVASGTSDTCALLTGGTVKCWGAQTKLDNGFRFSSNVPIAVDNVASARNVSDGGQHTCSTLSNGTIKCWGVGLNGELGNGEFATVLFTPPVLVSGITTAAQP